MSWFIIGISGVTCGGKTTLATRFYEYLNDASNRATLRSMHNIQINEVRLIHQDKYFYPRDSPNHIWVKDLEFINRELISAIDEDRFNHDIDEILNVKQVVNGDASDDHENNVASREASNHTNNQSGPIQLNILLIEGFLIFNDERINSRCHLKFFFHLTSETCWQRRRQRVFKHINPHPERYFREILWPSYKKHLDEIRDPSKIIFLNGELDLDDIFKLALRYFVEKVS